MIAYVKKLVNNNVVLHDLKSLLVFRAKEFLYAKKVGSLSKVVFDFPTVKGLPKIDCKFLNSDICHDFSFNGSAIDVIDFNNKKVERYLTTAPRLSRAIKLSKKTVKRGNMPKGLGYFAYFDAHKITPHTCHLSPNGYLLATNKYYIYFIDTKSNKLYILPGNYDKRLMLYCDTGGFSPDYKYWYFVRWPYEDTMAIRANKRERARCEICRVELETREIEIIDVIDYFDDVHQVALSSDNKYLLFTTFMQVPHVPYPNDISIEKNANGYKKSHQSGLKMATMVTYNLETKSYKETDVPVPVPAHFEFDPNLIHVCYLSAHNFVFHKNKVVLEGSGKLFRVQINDGKVLLTHGYSNQEFFRIQNHTVFMYNGKTYVGISTTPFKFELIDAEDLTVWRKIRIFPDPPPDLSLTGNALWKGGPPLTLNTSSDGKYIVCGMQQFFGIYDVENEAMLDVLLPLPKGRGQGHTRDLGK